MTPDADRYLHKLNRRSVWRRIVDAFDHEVRLSECPEDGKSLVALMRKAAKTEVIKPTQKEQAQA